MHRTSSCRNDGVRSHNLVSGRLLLSNRSAVHVKVCRRVRYRVLGEDYLLRNLRRT